MLEDPPSWLRRLAVPVMVSYDIVDFPWYHATAAQLEGAPTLLQLVALMDFVMCFDNCAQSFPGARFASSDV